MNSKVRPCHDVLRDVCRDLIKDYDRESKDFEKFVLSGKEPFILFLQSPQSIDSVKLFSNFLDITLNDRSFFALQLSTPFDYFFYIIGRYIKSLNVSDFCSTKHPFFRGLIDNEGLTEIRFEDSLDDPTWIKTLRSVQKISANQGFFRVLSVFNVDFSFNSMNVTSRMQYTDFSEFLQLRNLKSKELTIELYPIDYNDSLFHEVNDWSSLVKINLTINSNLGKPAGLSEFVNKLPRIFPNLEFCSLENTIEDESLDANAIKESISEIQSQFLSYTGRSQVEIKWNVISDVHLNWDDDVFQKFRTEISDRFPNYQNKEYIGTHEWTEKVFLTPNLSFESIITINEEEYDGEQLNQIIEDAAPKLKTNEMTTVQKDLYILPNETPVVPLDCTAAFETLTEKERKYAHFIARASAEGTLIVFLQVSPEAPALFVVLYELFKNESVESAKARALSSGWKEEEFTALLAFASGFYANGGNYRGFGDTKIIPNLEKEKLRAFLESSVAFKNNPKLVSAWNSIEDRVFSLDPNSLNLGFGNEGVTTYHTSNITKEDAELVDRYFKSKNIESWNTRLIKTEEDGKAVFTIFVASVTPGVQSSEEFEGVKIVVETGDYSPLLARINKELANAIPHAANDNQKQMLQKYIDHFNQGRIEDHKDGSRFWIKDVNPAVESYIGFIENYRDPAGTRSEFEGFVSAVNKETSRKFQTLVSRAEEILTRLPWGADYEKDQFLKPDFTALDVIFFGSSGIPAGINIPNYDDIRQNEGFKNVSLGNVISAIPKQRIEFLTAEDEELYKKYFKDSFEVQVGLHELLGHGSGKLFQFDGEKLNFDKEKVKDLITGGSVKTWYDKGETWSSKFGATSGAYEECRAEAVGYFLSCYPDILQIFGYEGEVAEDVKYVNWMNEIRAGLVALEFYQPESKKWGQAHCFARYVLLRVAMAAGQDFVTIEEKTGADGKPDLLFKLDRSKIDSVGKPAIGDFLKLLQGYKSTGDAAGGIKMFNEWGAVKDQQIRWRDIVVARRKPRRVFVQSNTVLNEKSEVELKTYPETFEGVVRSFVDRHGEDSVLDLLALWEENRF